MYFGMPFRGSVAVAAGAVSRGVLRGPRFLRLFPDVYVAADVPVDHLLFCRAATLYVGSDAVVSGLSALAVHGVPQLPLGEPTVEISVGRSLYAARNPRISVVRSAVDVADVVRRASMPVTSGVRTGFDLARRLPLSSAVAALDGLTHRHLATVDQIRAYALAHPAGDCCRQIARVLSLVDPASESPMESHTRVLLVVGGLPRPESQVEVFDANGALIGRLDLAYRRIKLGLEYDGDHHRSKDVFRRDVARLNALRTAGWEIVQVTADDIYRTPVKLVHEVRRLLVERAREMRRAA